MCELVTSDKKFQAILDEEKEKEEKKKEKEAKKKEKEAKKKEKENQDPKEKSQSKGKRTAPHEESESESSSNEESMDEEDEIRPDPEDNHLFPPKNDLDGYRYLSEVWDELNLPVQEKDLINKVFAFIFKGVVRLKI